MLEKTVAPGSLRSIFNKFPHCKKLQIVMYDAYYKIIKFFGYQEGHNPVC